jgi:hypothetical protein
MQRVLAVAVLQGSTLRKYGRRGQPKYHYFKLSQDDYCLQWESKKVGTETKHLRRWRASCKCRMRTASMAH